MDSYPLTTHGKRRVAPEFARNISQDYEALFSMHAVFRIIDVKPSDENGCFFEIFLTFTNNTVKELHDRLRQESSQYRNGKYSTIIITVESFRFTDVPTKSWLTQREIT